MIKSMTGFSSITHENDLGVIGVTIRAVNHRYLDLQLRAPASLSEREPALRAAVQRHVARGRIEVSVSLQSRQIAALQVELNAAFVGALHAALAQAREQGLIEGRLTPGDLLRLPQALSIREGAANAEPLPASLLDAVEGAVHAALTDLDRMRTHEGAQLRTDFAARRALLATLIQGLAEAAADGRTKLAAEIVRTAARSDISEEVTRFQAHLVHWDTLSDGPEPCGRKLDFLLQEMNREINTIGSKADGIGVSELIVNAKAELEKLREQVQNVE
jgi:uncharacterized protein YicC (UPF0701 family)